MTINCAILNRKSWINGWYQVHHLSALELCLLLLDVTQLLLVLLLEVFWNWNETRAAGRGACLIPIPAMGMDFGGDFGWSEAWLLANVIKNTIQFKYRYV